MLEKKYQRKATKTLNKIIKAGRFKIYRFGKSTNLRAHVWHQIPRIDDLSASTQIHELRIAPGDKEVKMESQRKYCRVSDLLKVADPAIVARLKVQCGLGVVM